MAQDDDGSIRLFLAICCFGCGGFTFLAISASAWIMKDGLLGTNSDGWLALHRYFAEAGCSLLIPTVLFVAGILLYRSDLRSTWMVDNLKR